MNIDTLARDLREGGNPDMEETRQLTPAQRNPAFGANADADEVCDVLNDLIEITRDGEEGFSHGAQYINDRALRDEFNQFSRERAQFVSELQRLERNYGKRDVDYNGSISGAFHRAWMDIRTIVTERDDQAILEEAERGEDAAVETYRKALSHEPPLPASVHAIVQVLANKIQRSHDRVRSLRDSGRYARKTA
jgi:uncharacterized protein (TIGR02284 family)